MDISIATTYVRAKIKQENKLINRPDFLRYASVNARHWIASLLSLLSRLDTLELWDRENTPPSVLSVINQTKPDTPRLILSLSSVYVQIKTNQD